MAGKLGKTGGKPCIKIRVCGQAQKGGSRAGDKERHAAAAISQGLGLVKPGDQGAAEGLMELIPERDGNGLRVTLLQGPQQHGRTGDVKNSVSVGNLLRQDTSGQVGGKLKIRDEGRTAPSASSSKVRVL